MYRLICELCECAVSRNVYVIYQAVIAETVDSDLELETHYLNKVRIDII